ncbi:hypothetical protein FRC02_004111 [Tulasnella sp. 418]|nr:hypothetical protein FRC02_004111 [Tulasnella sp. 418]
MSMPEPVSYPLPQVDDLNLESSTMFNKPNSAGKRPPIPDFNKHPTNTVPASVFKALAHSPEQHIPDVNIRPFARHKLSSREYLFDHQKRPSLDDNNIAPISMSMKLSTRLNPPQPIAMPAPIHHPVGPPAIALAPPPVKGRRSSFPAQTSTEEAPAPTASTPKFPTPVLEITASPPPMPSSVDIGNEPSRLEKIVGEKMAQIRDDVMALGRSNMSDYDSVIKAAIGQLVASFRTQMLEISRKSQEVETSGRVDAHGEVDFELIRSAIEQGRNEVRVILQQQLHELAEKVHREITQRPPPPSLEVLHSIEDLREMTISSVNSAITTLMAHMDTVDGYAQRRPVDERQVLIRELSAYLNPMLQSLRPEPFDIEGLTIQLADAVKPTLAQLIDLASDKKETAQLILEHLMPILQSIKPPRLDIEKIAHILAEDVVRLAPPTDPHVLKEEVSDLVVERLDARLRNRDNLLNPDLIVERILEIVQPLSDLTNIPSPQALNLVQSRQEELSAQGNALVEQQKEVVGKLEAIPSTLAEALETLKSAQAELVEKSKALEEIQELQRLASTNAELQGQLGKARSSHGQVRSEKDLIAQKLNAVEAERDRLKAELAALKEKSDAKDLELTESREKNETVNKELSVAVEKLKETQTASESQQTKMLELEEIKQHQELKINEQSEKIVSLETQVAISARDIEFGSEMRKRLEDEIQSLRAEQQRWDELRHTREQVDRIASLMNEAENEELGELRAIRDQYQELQNEYAALQKIFEEQDAEIVSLQKSAKQTGAESKQKLSQWERRAAELEAELEQMHTQLEQMTDSHRQLGVDVENIQAELDIKISEVAQVEEREQALRNQVASLESQLSTKKSELEAANAKLEKQKVIYAPRPQLVSNAFESIAVASGRPGPGTTFDPPSRPGTATPNNTHSSPNQAATPPEPDTPLLNKGLWDSMHAPKQRATNNYQPAYSQTATSKPSFARTLYGYRTTLPHAGSPFGRGNTVSPAPSTVSLAATEGPDGWWS